MGDWRRGFKTGNMKNSILENKAFQGVLEEIAEVAGYLWDRGWAERNAGNISVNITELLPNDAIDSLKPAGKIENFGSFDYLSGQILLVTASGSRMRDLAKNPAANTCIVLLEKGKTPAFYSPGENTPVLTPTSEIATHLAIQQMFLQKRKSNKVVLHAHVTEFIALTHNNRFRSGASISRMLWSMHPEVKMFCKEGVGFVPFALPGSASIARKTMKVLADHDIAIWERHGCISTGTTVNEAFDLLDILAKAVKIFYLIG